MAKYGTYKVSEEARQRQIERATRYNREVAAMTTIKMSKELNAAMMKYINDNGFKSKNSFILGLIKKEIGWTDEK